jgi:hypothetical protein
MNATKFLCCSICFVCVFVFDTAPASENAVELRDESLLSEAGIRREGLWLYIAGDGSWHSDSGPTNPEQLTFTFKKWRADGVEPGVQLNLYPKLKSNSNLVAIKNIIDFLKGEKISYTVRIESVEEEPEIGLE